MPASLDMNPLESLHETLALDTQSWSSDDARAWVYGVIVGWDADALKAISARYEWTPEDVARLGTLHRRFESMRRQ